MFNNKLDTYQSINNNIAKQINNALKRLPKSQACKVEEVKGNKVKVSRMLENNNTIGYTDNVPIICPIYFTYPIKQGDLGLLITSNYPVESYIKDYNTPPKNMAENSNGQGYLFLPLAPDNIDFIQETENIQEARNIDVQSFAATLQETKNVLFRFISMITKFLKGFANCAY